MKVSEIKGKVVFVELAQGFYGIESTNGQQFLPVNMPEQLKVPGATVSCRVIYDEEAVSIFMWGTAVHIISFKTISY